jgi:hypothetical protein
MSGAGATLRRPDSWPALPLEEWKDTCATLHMWTQIIGKIRMALSPRTNHYWEVPLYVNSRGLTTSPIPYGNTSFEIQFDFIDHKLLIHKSDGTVASFALAARPVSAFYDEVMRTLQTLGIEVKIWTMPVEIPDPIRFEQDQVHSSYDAGYANRFWRILVCIDSAFKEFRARFAGKNSPVHFFWGSFDLASTRFSGRRAPERVGANRITKEAYSHEVISAGFWPGGGAIADAAFYCYAAPEPPGFSKASVRPNTAFYSPQFSEFILMYDEVRKSASPREVLLDFLQTTYEAAATLGKWDRGELERTPASAGMAPL